MVRISGFERIGSCKKNVRLLAEFFVRYISIKEYKKVFSISIPLSVWNRINAKIKEQIIKKGENNV